MRKGLCLSLFFRVLAGQPALAGFAHNPKNLVFDGGGVTMLAWSPDGKYVAACTMGGACRLWDAASGNILATAPGLGPSVEQTDGIAFSTDGKALVLPDDGALLIWPRTAGTATHEVTFPAPYNSSENFQGFRHCGPNGSLIESIGDDFHSLA
jgi:WD40 repeat protein